MEKTVLVTGAAGFIGFHLCQKIMAEGFRVIGVDNFCTGNTEHRDVLLRLGQDKKNVLFFDADVSEPWTWTKEIPKEWLRSCERVFHLASPASPAHYLKLSMETLAANSVGLQNALNFADAVKAHLVFASTSEVYGASAHKQQSEEQWGCVNSYGPRSCYQEAKRFGEALIYSHNKRKGSKHGLVRIFNTYGPHMNPEDGRVVINFLIQARRKEALTVYGNGQQTRSFCYITDLIEGLNIYSKKSMATPVNLGNPEEMTVLALTEVIASLFPERQIEVAHKELPQEDPVQRCPDITRAFQLLDGWKPQVPLREGLKLMNAWLEESAR